MKNKNYKRAMSKEHPFIVLIKLLTIFDYKDEILKINGEYVTPTQIKKAIGDSNDGLKISLDILKEYGLAYRTRIAIVDENGNYNNKVKKQEVVVINPKIVKAINYCKRKRNSVWQEDFNKKYKNSKKGFDGDE